MSLTIETTTMWVPTCEVTELELGWGEVALLAGQQVALLRVAEEEVYAVDHHDPYTGAPVMARGIVGSRGDRPTLASPLHKQVYDLGTGECFTDSALALRTYRTRIVGGMIEVELEG